MLLFCFVYAVVVALTCSAYSECDISFACGKGWRMCRPDQDGQHCGSGGGGLLLHSPAGSHQEDSQQLP